MTTNTTPAPIGADARSRFIAWAAAFFPDDGLARAARAWEENRATAVAWRAALAGAAQPALTVTARYDLSPAAIEGAIRDKLIEMGWTPPDAAKEGGA